MFRTIQHYIKLFRAIFVGTIYILYYRIFTRNVKIGFPLIAYGRVSITGPGEVVIAKKTTVAENVFRGLVIVTMTKQARVKIGGKGLLAGLTIRCAERVEIGERVMTALSLVQDRFFVNSIGSRTGSPDLLDSKPVRIGNNVWLGGHVCVLRGSDIGDDCVLSAGTVCSDIKMDRYTLGSGNPMRRALPIEQMLLLRRSNETATG